MHMGRMGAGNGDQAVTQADFTARALARFDQADANKDGTVTREERRAAKPERGNRAGGAPRTTAQ